MRYIWIIVFVLVSQLFASGMSEERLIPTYLYNFAKYTNWPENYDKKVFHIHLLSSNKKLYLNMKKLVENKNLHNRPVKVSIGSDKSIAYESDMIFMDKAYLNRYKKVYQSFEGRPILLVSYAYDNERLVMINLKKTKDETFIFEINKENIINQGLSINPKLILLGGTELDVAKLYKETRDSLLSKEEELQKQLLKAQKLSQEIKNSKEMNLALEKSIYEKNQNVVSLNRDMKNLQEAIMQMRAKAKASEEELSALVQKQKEILALEKASTQKMRDDFKVAKVKLIEQENEVAKKEKELASLSQSIQEKAVEFKALQEDLADADVQIKDKDLVIDVQQDYLLIFTLALAVFLILVLTILRILREKHVSNVKLSQTQEELEKQIIKTEKADASKTKFLAHMSHELRTPLNAVLGYSQILQKDASMSAKNKKTIATINRSGEHLLSLINDVLEVSKIESGKVDLDPIAFDLYLFLDDINEMFMQRIQERNLYFEIEKAQELPQFIFADINKLRQIFINILGNAVKFTSEGGIKVKMRLDAKNNILSIQIQDSGAGISEEEIDKLFKPFEQTMSGKVGGGGAGLGLSIVMEYVELMQGSIKVQSELEVGTSFYLKIPFEPSTMIEARNSQQQEVQSLRQKDKGIEILIADDNKTNNALLEELLENVGFKVYKVENGAEALASFKQHRQRAVLLDIEMPVMNGFEAAQAIKALDYGAQTPIIAVTASIFDVVHSDVLKQGFDALIHKPFKDYDIYMALAKFLHIKYLHKDEKIEDNVVEIDVKGLDSTFKQKLLEALKKMKIASVKDLLLQLESTHPAEAKYMQGLAEDFEYDALQALLNEEA